MAKRRPDIPEVKLEAERFLLGSLLEYSSTRPHIMPLLAPEHFTLDRHRKIFVVVKTLYDKSQDINISVVLNELLASGAITLHEQPIAYLLELTRGVPEIPSYDSHIRILRDFGLTIRLRGVANYLESQLDIFPQLPVVNIISDVTQKLEAVQRETELGEEVPRADQVIDALGGPLEILHPTAGVGSIKTGFRALDALTTGLELGTLSIIAGRPSQGKSALALCMSRNMAEAKIPVAFFSMEMAKKALIDRLMCGVARIDMAKLRNGRLSLLEEAELRRALGQIYGWPLYIDDEAVRNIGDISRRLDRLVTKYGVRVGFVDFVQLMTSGSRHKGDRRSTTEILGEIAEAFKALAKRLNIAIVILSQLSRDPEKRMSGNHRPMLSDLRDSGSLEQVADLVCAVYRETVYKPSDIGLKNYAEIMILKQRQGATGNISLRFYGDLGALFEDS